MNEVPTTFEPCFNGRSESLPEIKVMCVFGTRPEVIKFLPVLKECQRVNGVRSVNVVTSQHTNLITPLLEMWDISVDHDLGVMKPGQGLNELMARIQMRIDTILEAERPDIVLVQGDTTTALAGALAAWHRRIPVGHIEAGLRSGFRETPFPEEMNRRLTSSLATLHFAPTTGNVANLTSEGVDPDGIILAGNPVVDAVNMIRGTQEPSQFVQSLMESLSDRKVVLMTTHRRESFGEVMRHRMQEMKRFVEKHEDTALVFPVHSNPAVLEVAESELGGVPRVHLVEPLTYPDFLYCLSRSWLVVSDSGGVQEEAPSLGKPLLIIRGNTERPETVECGVARLVGEDPATLRAELEEAALPGSWITHVKPTSNPFGLGDSAKRIVAEIVARHRMDAGASSPGGQI